MAIKGFNTLRDLTNAIGALSTAKVLSRRAAKSSAPVEVHTRHGLVVRVRPMESDFRVLAEVFGRDQYKVDPRRLEALRRKMTLAREAGATPVIVDGGANVGYASVLFAMTFPLATVVAVEPDPVTYAELVENTRGLPNVLSVHGALWRDCDGVSLGRTDEPSWARTTTRGGLIPSFTLEAVLEMVPLATPLLLKLDIEGAEREVLETSSMLAAQFPALMIEPHDHINLGKGCLSPLYTALSGRTIDTLAAGENIYFYDGALAES